MGKILRIFMPVFAVLFVGAVLLLPVFLQSDIARHFIVQQIEQATGGQVALGELSWETGRRSGFKAKDFSIDGATDFPGTLKVSGLEITIEVLPLLSGKLIVHNLHLQRPELTLPLLQNIAVAEKPVSAAESTAGSLSPEIKIKNFSLTHGRLVIEDSLSVPGKKITSTFTDMQITAGDITPGQAIRFRFSFNALSAEALGSLAGEATFSGLDPLLNIQQPDLKVSVFGRNLPAGLFKAYIQDEVLADQLAGSLSMELNYRGDMGQIFSLDGFFDLSQLTYTNPALWENVLPGQASRIQYQLNASDDVLQVNSLDITLGGISLVTRATIQNWSQDALFRDVLLSGKLPLKSLLPLIPWSVLGETGEDIRNYLHQQGEIDLQRLTLDETSLASIMADPHSLWPKLEISAGVSAIALTPPLELPDIRELSGSIALQQGKLTVSDLQGDMGPLLLPPIQIQATDIDGVVKIFATAKGPLQLAPEGHDGVSALLEQYGLQTLTGKAVLDMQMNYDSSIEASKGVPVEASGKLMLKGVNMISYPHRVQMNDLQGQIALQQGKKLDIRVTDLSGKLQGSAFYMDGRFSSLGNPDLQVDAKIRTGKLDLEDFAGFDSALQKYELQGGLDMDVHVHYLHAKPEKSRLKGQINLHNGAMRMADNQLRIRDAKTALEFKGNSVTLRKTALRLNDQRITITGRLSNPRYPHGWLRLASSRLNINQLLDGLKRSSPAANAPHTEQTEPAAFDTGTASLPEWLKNVTLRLKTSIRAGEYNHQPFKNLHYTVDYKRGLLNNQKLELDIETGHISTLATADIRDTGGISFSIEPELKNVPLSSLEKITSQSLNFSGPVSLTGKISGKTGDLKRLLRSLNGHLSLQGGPGTIKENTPLIKPLFTVLSVINLQGLLPGKLGRNFSSRGIPYDSYSLNGDFSAGEFRFDELKLLTPAIIITGTGKLELPEQQLEMHARVQILGMIDTLLGLIPLVGKPVNELTSAHLEIKGPLTNVVVQVKPEKTVTRSLHAVVKEPLKAIQGLMEKLQQTEESQTKIEK